MNIRTVLLRVLIPVENGLSWLIDRLDPPPADPERGPGSWSFSLAGMEFGPFPLAASGSYPPVPCLTVDGVEPAWPVTGFDGRVIGLGAFRAGES